jgi:hypothetical protein
LGDFRVAIEEVEVPRDFETDSFCVVGVIIIDDCALSLLVTVRVAPVATVSASPSLRESFSARADTDDLGRATAMSVEFVLTVPSDFSRR